ncbi:MAG: hypothetical protein ACI3VB_04780 [Oscillospiraceae bacterium]
MADIIQFDGFSQEPDIYGMSSSQLSAYLADIRDEIARLDEQEPEDMLSDEYEEWGDRHEELEDLADEILDLLDGMDD